MKKYNGCPFIFIDDNGNKHMIPALLAKYVKEENNFIFVKDSAKESVCVYLYDEGVYKECSVERFQKTIKDAIEKFAVEFSRMSSIREAQQMILADNADSCLNKNELNQREEIINFQNGLLTVTCDEIKLVQHTPKFKSTIQIPCEWKLEDVPTPVFDAYLDTLTNGDKEIQQLLLEFMGVCISNIKGWRMKKSLFLVGEGNR